MSAPIPDPRRVSSRAEIVRVLRESGAASRAEIALRTGLSRATVSYVLNDTPHQKIPEETRQRVLAAAASLGYAPSAAARALRSGRSELVLCLLPDWPMGPEVGALLEIHRMKHLHIRAVRDDVNLLGLRARVDKSFARPVRRRDDLNMRDIRKNIAQ